MTVALDDELTAFFRADEAAISWPYPMYHRLLDAGVVDWRGGPAWVLARHAHVKEVMSGSLPVANDGYRYGRMAETTIGRLPGELRPAFFDVFDFETLFMSRHDGDHHQRLRRVAAGAFTARRVAELREKIAMHVDDLLDQMAAADAPDWKRDVADRLPVRIIAELMGVPAEDRGLLWDFAETIADHFSVDAGTLSAAHEALGEFRIYVDGLICKVRRTGRGTPLAKLLIAAVDEDVIDHDELVAMYLLILFGGSETTTNLLGNGFLALQRFREQWDGLIDRPELIRPAIEELLRFDAPLHYLLRVAEDDFALGDAAIAKGDTVIICIGAANRDPERFEDPDRLWVERPNAKDHLGLAFGPHFCLGAALARMEADIAFSAVARRFPGARLLTDDVPYRGSAMLRAVAALPVELR